jgi:hypothetical protein
MSQTLKIIEPPHFEGDPTLNDYLATISAKSAFLHDMISTKIDENNGDSNWQCIRMLYALTRFCEHCILLAHLFHFILSGIENEQHRIWFNARLVKAYNLVDNGRRISHRDPLAPEVSHADNRINPRFGFTGLSFDDIFLPIERTVRFRDRFSGKNCHEYYKQSRMKYMEDTARDYLKCFYNKVREHLRQNELEWDELCCFRDPYQHEMETLPIYFSNAGRWEQLLLLMG